MKKKFITLGALAIMVALSSQELKANVPSSATTPNTILQGYSTNNHLTKFEFQRELLYIISDMSGVDISTLELYYNEYTFYNVGFDSLDIYELLYQLEKEYDIYGLNESGINWYKYPISYFADYCWKRYCICNS